VQPARGLEGSESWKLSDGHHAAAVAEHLALVRHGRPLLRGGVAAPGGAVGAEVAVRVEAHEAHHVPAVAVVAAVGDDGGGGEGAVGEGDDVVGLHRERGRGERLVPREGGVVTPVEVGDGVGGAGAGPSEREVARGPVDGEDVGPGGEVHDFMPEVKFCDITTVSVGWSKDCHSAAPVLSLSTRLPLSWTAAADTFWPPVLEDQSTAPGSVDELEVAVGREAERAPRVNGGAVARGPDGHAADVGDGGDEERRGGRGRREAEREGAVGRRPRRRVARREGRPQRHVRAAGQQREEEEAAAEGHKAPLLRRKGRIFLPSRRFGGGRKQRRTHAAGTAAVSTTLIVVHYWYRVVLSVLECGTFL
jgi:hypothetical protein